MILVTGATGIVGRRVVTELLDAGQVVRATSRAPATARLPAGVEIFDTAQPADQLLNGCDAVLINASAMGADPLTRLQEFVDAANTLKVRRLAQLSTASVHDRLSPAGRWHRSLQEVTEEFRRTRYVLQPAPLALNTIHWWAPTVCSGRFAEGPYLHAPMTPIDEHDVARVAACLLADVNGEYRGPQELLLTGPQILTLRQQIDTWSMVLGFDIAVREISATEARRRLIHAGVAPTAIDTLLRSFEMALEHSVQITRHVEQILHRAPTSFAAWAQRNRAAFTGHRPPR